MHHVEVDGNSVFQHPLELAVVRFRVARVVDGSPVVEPSAPEFPIHAGAFRSVLAEEFEGVFSSSAEGEGSGQIRQRTVFEASVGRLVGRVELDVGKSSFFQGIEVRPKVFLVVGIGSVFVFHLGHDDGTSFGCLERG